MTRPGCLAGEGAGLAALTAEACAAEMADLCTDLVAEWKHLSLRGAGACLPGDERGCALGTAVPGGEAQCPPPPPGPVVLRGSGCWLSPGQLCRGLSLAVT